MIKYTDIGHILYGVLTVFAPIHIAPIMAVLFVIYELDEEWHIEDQSYRDIMFYMIGIAIGVIIWLILHFASFAG